MAQETEKKPVQPQTTLIKTREVITVGETARKAERVQRDQKDIDMVKERDAKDAKFHWSYDIVGGKVRVALTPRR